MKKEQKLYVLIGAVCLAAVIFGLYRSSLPNNHKRSDEAKIAIILDDVGEDKEAVGELTSLPYPLTFSVIPGGTYSYELSQEIWSAEKEVMLHMPMEAENKKLSEGFAVKLDKKMSAGEIKKNLDQALREIAFASGVNNHAGSAFLASKPALEKLMPYLAQKKLYFVSSGTSKKDSSKLIANKYRVPFAARTIFLDYKAGEDYMRRQIKELKKAAQANRTAIGICHITRPDTIKVLKETLPLIEDEDTKLVFVSEVVK
ncbi:MAG: divergent polysaccharide deacetylase family protein [Candidatus Margulisiibacteriota bacterium]|jgi:hypothetical protein